MRLLLAWCLFDFLHEIWLFFFEHDGVAFYAERPHVGVAVVATAVVIAVVWHLLQRQSET
ncbi:hypothetical protein [Botrimarina hoheduenensis]|uniref:hypothetical protein n=1 Tax=Botrimarina hoheduenensis TaxID=2528000 RepID=UPI0011B7D773|nr:hypothetical protein [Botrimarina hoheduenensis]